ncbi:putative reverse transcriptase domain-containing protein [Tanacetum coccineum]|uniref:Reverse transcriptase domain-containing protein n=1 Tax=Tanacetum coccineum TaxID=301880 RepID=A0ABQ4WSW1_9ASTR
MKKDSGSFTLPCFINNVCFYNAFVDLGASGSVMPLSTYLSLGLGKLAHTKLTVELADRTVKYPKGIAENVLVGIGKFTFLVDFIILDMPEDIKVSLILGRPFLSTVRAKIDVYKRKLTLRVGEERIVFTSVKPANPFLEDYIKLNDLNEPFELRRNQGDDLMPTIEEGEVIEEFRTRDDELNVGIDDYPSYCDYDKKIHIDFLKNIDDYRDEGMGDVIFGEPFLRKVGIKTRRFEGMITIYNGDNDVTYQMVRSHPMFEFHTNEQCNKIPPLLKIYYSDNQYAVSIKEDTAYPCLHSPKTTKERRSIRRIQKMSIRHIEDIANTFRRHFKTLSLDELRSPDFNLFSDQENSEEEEAETMAETMEQYMSKTRADYGSGVVRPKIEDKDNFELKWPISHKELQTNNFRRPNVALSFPSAITGDAIRWLRNKPTSLITTWEDLKTKFLSKYCPPARTAKKMEEINNFQQEPDENLYQAWERFKELLMKCPQHYLTDMQEVVLFYNGLDVPTRQILDSRGAIPSKTVADAKTAIQEMAEYSQKWHNGTSRVRSTETSDGLATTLNKPIFQTN